jgi:hypothetical protein
MKTLNLEQTSERVIYWCENNKVVIESPETMQNARKLLDASPKARLAGFSGITGRQQLVDEGKCVGLPLAKYEAWAVVRSLATANQSTQTSETDKGPNSWVAKRLLELLDPMANGAS